MGWINLNFLLVQMLFTASVLCYREYDLYDMSDILSSGIDDEINPCDNFYDYACGKWKKNNEIPSVYDVWSVNEMSQFTISTVIRDIFEKGNINNSNTNLLMEKKFYDACMDSHVSRKEGIELFKKIIIESAGTKWQDVAEYYASKVGETNLFDVNLNKGNVLEIKRPSFFESNKQPYEDIIDYTDERVSLLSVYTNETSINNSRAELVEFIKSVNELVNNSERELYETTILNFQLFYDENCPSLNAKIDWLKIFQKLAEGSGVNFTNLDLIHVDVNYLKNLSHLLSRTSDNAIVNYLHYNFIMDEDTYIYINIIFDEFRDSMKYPDCIQKLPIKKWVYEELINFYISPESKNMVDEMFNNLKIALITEIRNSWLVSDVKQVALQKVKQMKYKYEIVENSSKKKERHHVSYNFEVGPIGLQNQINFKKAQMINDIQIYKNSGVHREKRSPVANAFYCSETNEIGISPTMLVPPVFNLNAPVAFNYGILASTIGHEISHAFDFAIMEKIIKLNTAADYFEKSYMISVLRQKKQCFVDEFLYLNVDGYRTLEENMADTQGLILAYKAMHAVDSNKTGISNTLPNFETWNQDKLFFLSFANGFCLNSRNDEDDDFDEHSPNTARVIGTLMNMNTFKKTFECKNDAFMHRRLKCNLWSY